MRKRRVAFLLRAVNVGGRNRLPMAELRASLEQRGLERAETVLQSGNVLADTALARSDAEDLVSSAISQDFSLNIATVALELDELDQIFAEIPLLAGVPDPSTLVVAVLRATPSDETVVATPLPRPEAAPIELRGRFVFQSCPQGVSSALPLAPWLERSWGATATIRNLRTLGRLAEQAAAQR